MQLPKRSLKDAPLRPEPHVQQVIKATDLDKLPEPEPIKSTMRLNVDIDTDIYNEVFIKARRQGKRMSDVVRAMMVEYLSK